MLSIVQMAGRLRAKAHSAWLLNVIQKHAVCKKRAVPTTRMMIVSLARSLLIQTQCVERGAVAMGHAVWKSYAKTFLMGAPMVGYRGHEELLVSPKDVISQLAVPSLHVGLILLGAANLEKNPPMTIPCVLLVSAPSIFAASPRNARSPSSIAQVAGSPRQKAPCAMRRAAIAKLAAPRSLVVLTFPKAVVHGTLQKVARHIAHLGLAVTRLVV